jgi:coenzyme F420-0:L-glutamate ligase/coenzyme F420-1:gamma-L-glutamate ligase
VTAPAVLHVLAVTGVTEVGAGDDLAAALVAALDRTGAALADGDLVVVASKVVAKAEGRAVAARGRDDAVTGETVRVVAERRTPRGLSRIVQARSGPVLAAAGVDASNVAAGTVLLLPADPDSSARALRARLGALTGRRVGVVVTDTLGRPWRDGQVDAAIGAAGVAVTDDLRGAWDTHGNRLEVTVRAVADEVASAADLVKGKLDGVPVALVRGLAHFVTDDDGPGAATLLRDAAGDWFRLGHVEAVRTALGAGPALAPGTDGVGPRSVLAEGVEVRARRAVAVALGPRLVAPDAVVQADLGQPDTGQPDTGPDTVTVRFTGADPAALAAVVERLGVAAWSEDLAATLTADGSAPGSATVRLRSAPG